VICDFSWVVGSLWVEYFGVVSAGGVIVGSTVLCPMGFFLWICWVVAWCGGLDYLCGVGGWVVCPQYTLTSKDLQYCMCIMW